MARRGRGAREEGTRASQGTARRGGPEGGGARVIATAVAIGIAIVGLIAGIHYYDHSNPDARRVGDGDTLAEWRRGLSDMVNCEEAPRFDDETGAG